MTQPTENELRDLTKRLLDYASEYDPNFPNDLATPLTTEYELDDNGSLTVTIWFQDNGFGYAIDSEHRIWKLDEAPTN